MRRVLAAAGFALVASAAPAANLGLVSNPAQGDFHSVSQDVIAVTSYKALGPAEAGGLTGFSVGPYATYTSTRDRGAWKRLTGDDVDAVGAVGINARKGLPFGIDLGALYAKVPGTKANLLGGEVRWAPLPGGTATPAVAVRGSYVRMSGEKDVKADSKTLDVSVSKGFLFFTPYAGAGYVWGTVKADPQFLLQNEDVNKARFFAGFRVSMGFLELTPEYEHLGSNSVYNLRLSIGL